MATAAPNPFALAADLLDPPAPVPDPLWTQRHEHWLEVGRPEQQIPPGDWLIWLILAGRGYGKTRTGAETVSEWARMGPGQRFALVGQTFTDGRDTMVEGESGLLSVLPPSALRGGNVDGAWNRSLGELFFANGAQLKLFSAEKPGQLRGPQHHKAWVDEPAKFKDAKAGDALDTAWNNLMLGMRLPGAEPQVVVTGTPTSCLLIRQLVAHPRSIVTRGSTFDNLANLARAFKDEIIARYEGTRLGRQELHGEVLEDVVGALWTLILLDELRVAERPPDLSRVVVAIDPAGGTSSLNDETGIIVAARGADAQGYVLADRSGRYTPNAWALKAVAAYNEFGADRIVAETNYGGDMVIDTLRTAGFKGHVEKVTASRGKRQRAEPVAALYEQRRMHHVGFYPAPGPGQQSLEDQMTTWLPDSGTSPDRMDALVWAFTDLFVGSMTGQAWLDALSKMAEEPEPVSVPDIPRPNEAPSLGRRDQLQRRR